MGSLYVEETVGWLAPEGLGFGFANGPYAVLDPGQAHRCVHQEPTARKYGTSEHACTPVDLQSRPMIATLRCRYHSIGLYADV